MGMSMRLATSYPRRHGAVLAPEDRRQLELDGWRTTLDYRENHVRAGDGRLLEVITVWTAEAERFDDRPIIATACGATPEQAWRNLRNEVASKVLGEPPADAHVAVRLLARRP